MQQHAVPTIRFSDTVKKLFRQPDDETVAKQALENVRVARDPRLRPVAPTVRQIKRRRHLDAQATARKSRRNAANQRRAMETTQQTLIGWAEVYLNGKGTDAMRRNVTEAVHRQAEIYSKQAGEPFTTSLKRVEEALLSALIASRR